jgi:hypothetical protein
MVMAELTPADLSLFSNDELEELKVKVKAAIFERKITVGLAFSGKNANYQVEIPLKELIRALSIELRRRGLSGDATFDNRTSATFS